MAKQDLSPVGPSDGTQHATVYYWPFYLHLLGFLLPAVLLVLVLCKANRTRDAWLALVPAFAWPWVVGWGIRLSGGERYLGYIYDAALITAFWLAMLWLLSNRLPHERRRVSMARALGVVVLGALLGFVAISGFQPRYETYASLMVYGLFACSTLISLALAGWLCRQHYTPRRFLLRHFLILALGLGALAAVSMALLTFMPRILSGDTISMGWVQFHLLNSVLPVGLAGLGMFIATLPYLALAFWSPTYRPRFHALFRLPGMDFVPKDVHNEASSGDGCS